jgi:hypothetical protein
MYRNARCYSFPQWILSNLVFILITDVLFVISLNQYTKPRDYFSIRRIRNMRVRLSFCEI